MLIDFTVENFRSFKDEQEFSMETGARLRKFKNSNTIRLNTLKKRVLKSSIVFGANANGKTNLIYALIMLKNLIVNPTNDDVQKLKFDSFAHKKGDTKFKITFSQKQKEYHYELQYNPDEVVKESLAINNKLLFERNRQNFGIIPNQLVSVKNNIRKNQLMLFFAQQNNEENSRQAYRWFAEELILISTRSVPNKRFENLKNGHFKNKFINFLQAADFNIVDVEIRERYDPNPAIIAEKLGWINDGDENMPPATKVYDVYFNHKSNHNDFQLSFNEESEGTKVFICLALNILLNQNKVLLIDEFDRAYHVELSKALVNLINSENQNNQFIMNSHNLSLMDCNLRTDQIWFAEKNRFGESSLFSLFDFDDPKIKGKNVKYKRRYLEGIYGATQIIDEDLLRKAMHQSE